MFGTKKRTLFTVARIATAAFVLLIIGFLSIGALFAWYAKDLPRPDRVKRTVGLSTVILDRNGESLYDIYENENRIPAKWEDIPDHLKNATVSIEDKAFYQHPGISTAGIVRALINIIVFRNFQGGSTLTQQLVKNVLLTQERTVPRKIKEAILSIQIERKYTKDEILTMYLNETPYGGTAVGVEAASEYYFGKPVKELGLIESAFLAGLPQSPSAYSPFTGTKDAYIWRTEQVLRRMREDGHISPTQEVTAKTQLKTLAFKEDDSGLKAPHFVAYIKELLIAKFGTKQIEEGGLRVTTTLDWKLQEEAQNIVSEEVDKAKRLKVSNGAAVVMDPKNGEILAMIGSRDYSATDSGGFKFNVATQGLRQPGSALKPITYATAFKKGYTASSLLMDVDTKYPSGDPAKKEYDPKNYDGKYRGPMQLRYALANSINTVAVKVSALVGIRDILTTAYDMGLSTLEPTDANMRRFGLSLTLGGGEVTLLELTRAFGVFAAEGVKHEPVAILKVVDSKGYTLFEQKQSEGTRVLPQDICYLISDILSDNDARKAIFGERSYLAIPGKSVAVKTGTTDDKRDNWTVGYTRSRVVGVWVGNNDNSPMNPTLASGITGAAPIWNRLIKKATETIPDEPFVRPGSIIETEIDSYGGGLPAQDGPKRTEKFIKGNEPAGISPIYKQIKTSRKDPNKLANQVEINKGEYDTKTFVVFIEKDPVSTDGKNRWQEGIDAWVSAQGDSKFHPPTEVYSEGDKISLRATSPEDLKQYDSNSIEVKVEVASLEGFDRMEIYIDNDKKKETRDSRISENFTIPDGSHIVKIRVVDVKGNTAEREIHVGIKTPYVTPTSMPSPSPSPTP